MQVISFRNGIGGYQYFIVIPLILLFLSSIEVSVDGVLVSLRSICRGVFEYGKTVCLQSRTKIIGGIGKLCKYNNFALGLLGKLFVQDTFERFQFGVAHDSPVLSEPFLLYL